MRAGARRRSRRQGRGDGAGKQRPTALSRSGCRVATPRRRTSAANARPREAAGAGERARPVRILDAEAAWRDLRRRLLGLIARRVRDPSAAEDIFQEVMLRSTAPTAGPRKAPEALATSPAQGQPRPGGAALPNRWRPRRRVVWYPPGKGVLSAVELTLPGRTSASEPESHRSATAPRRGARGHDRDPRGQLVRRARPPLRIPGAFSRHCLNWDRGTARRRSRGQRGAVTPPLEGAGLALSRPARQREHPIVAGSPVAIWARRPQLGHLRYGMDNLSGGSGGPCAAGRTARCPC